MELVSEEKRELLARFLKDSVQLKSARKAKEIIEIPDDNTTLSWKTGSYLQPKKKTTRKQETGGKSTPKEEEPTAQFPARITV